MVNIKVDYLIYKKIGGNSMSAFLGPIHHWLFKKILLLEKLEKNILKDLSIQYNNENLLEEISEEVQGQFGSFLPDKPLEMLIDTDNIHGWLQSRIAIAEKRYAATIKKALDNFGEESLSIIEKAHIQQGQEIGIEVANNRGVLNAPELYQELNNYLLEGMPCDHVNSVIHSTEDSIQWQITHCLHKDYWSSVNMEVDIMYNLRFYWVKAYVEGANLNFTYTVNRKGLNEASLHSITLK